jgi:hypothetical protein
VGIMIFPEERCKPHHVDQAQDFIATTLTRMCSQAG